MLTRWVELMIVSAVLDTFSLSIDLTRAGDRLSSVPREAVVADFLLWDG